MTSEQWPQIEALYHRVVDLSVADQRALLEQADSEIRHEVESLLAQSGSLLDKPAWEAKNGTATITLEAASADARLGPYQLEQQIGSGGMGQVFRALDTRLNRAVAIKISTEGFGERFQREARSIAQLNHPHICTLHDVGPNYLVMELLEGETLAARLTGPGLQVWRSDRGRTGGCPFQGNRSSRSETGQHHDYEDERESSRFRHRQVCPR